MITNIFQRIKKLINKMSKKLAIASVFVLILGGISITGSILLNNYITDLTYSSVDEGLLGIKEEGIPIIKDSVHELGPKALAVTFELMREKGISASKPVVNGTFLMGQIYSVDELDLLLGGTLSKIFWDWPNGTYIGSPGLTFSGLTSLVGYPPIMGIAEWYSSDLNFTAYNLTTGADIWGGVNRLKYGVDKSGWWGDRLPGVYEDTFRRVEIDNWPPNNLTHAVELVDLDQDRGFGIIEMLELIENANDTQIELMAGPNGYNLSNPYDTFTYKSSDYNKLEIFRLYFADYFVQETLSLFITDFNDNSTTLYSDFPLYRPRDWNGNNISYEEIAYYSYIEQWAKCRSYDDGADFHNTEPAIPEGTRGLEPGGPGNSSGIPMQAALQLWNKANEYSLVNETGINKWCEAYSNNSVKNEILAEFSKYPGYEDADWNENDTYGESDWGFNETDMNLLLDWLWGNGGGWEHGSFYNVTLPKLIYDDIAFEILLEQWANGTIYGDKAYPEGFPLPLGNKEIFGFEVGIPNPTNMSLESALALWNISSENSLVSKEGLTKWFGAVGGDVDIYTELKTANNLNNESMDLILQWLPNFQRKVMPHLAQYQYNLPTDSITLGNSIQLGGIIIGSVSLGLGIAGISRIYLKKRKIVKE